MGRFPIAPEAVLWQLAITQSRHPTSLDSGHHEPTDGLAIELGERGLRLGLIIIGLQEAISLLSIGVAISLAEFNSHL